MKREENNGREWKDKDNIEDRKQIYFIYLSIQTERKRGEKKERSKKEREQQ